MLNRRVVAHMDSDKISTVTLMTEINHFDFSAMEIKITRGNRVEIILYDGDSKVVATAIEKFVIDKKEKNEKISIREDALVIDVEKVSLTETITGIGDEKEVHDYRVTLTGRVV
jgi:hypothetical protein